MDAKTLRKIYYLLILILLAAMAGCAVNPVTGRSELALVSEQQEVEIGKKEYPFSRQAGGGDYKDDDLDRYVNEVGRRLAAVSHRPDIPFQFKVIDSSVPNAFALPGGPIAIHRGLLASLENEAQLAAVLGHEIGHVTARHYVQSVSSNMLLNVGLVAVGVGVSMSGTDFGQPIMLGSAVAANMANMKFSRSHEEQSDRLGIDYMVRAGYDPQGAVQLQEYFYKVVEKEKKPDWLEGLFRTHPFSMERMEANRRMVNSMPRQSNWTLGEDEFRRRTAALKNAQEAYKVFDEGQKLAAKKQNSEAMAKFDEAIKKAPDRPPFYRERGALHIKDERYDSAEKDLKKSLSLDSDFYKTHYYLGLLNDKQGKKKEAEAEFKQSMQLLPTREAAYHLGKYYEETGASREAFRYLDMAVQGGGDDELARDAKHRWETHVLRESPAKLVAADVRPAGTNGRVAHSIAVKNGSSHALRSVRIKFGYLNATGKLLDVREITVENIPAGKTITYNNAGYWFVPPGTMRVQTQVSGVTFSE